MLIEQAIFTSARTARAAGYQVVAATSGIGSGDLEEIAVWGPSHDSLIDHGPGATSTNFWCLQSGNYCISRTTTSGGEYSGRVGPCVYTQCLIPPVDVFLKFANNPFALLRAAMVQGALEVHREVPRQLDPIRLAGRAAAIDQTVLTEVLADAGPRALVALVDVVLRSGRVAVVSNSKPSLLAALVNCLPIECRLELSFSTGLEVSPRRPFRIVWQPDDPAVVRRIGRLGSWQVVRLSEISTAPTASWAVYLDTMLVEGKTAVLATKLAKRRPQLTMATLESLARALASVGEDEPDRPSTVEPAGDVPAAFPRLARVAAADEANREVRDPERERTAADEVAAESAFAAAIPISASRGRTFGEQPPAKEPPAGTPAAPPNKPRREAAPPAPRTPVHHDPAHPRPRSAHQSIDSAEPSHTKDQLEALEQLDDVVFDALVGREAALEQLRRLWPETLGRLGERQLAESRDHYLRRALSVWRQATTEREIRDPLQALTAIEVICLLYGE
ncbi:MAG: hypothetical protein K2Y37_06105 [Pirellulales bacterium]|nr:hypothetical protein [Pirellulales bacterium]